jgi:hypothetical protein
MLSSLTRDLLAKEICPLLQHTLHVKVMHLLLNRSVVGGFVSILFVFYALSKVKRIEPETRPLLSPPCALLVDPGRCDATFTARLHDLAWASRRNRHQSADSSVTCPRSSLSIRPALATHSLSAAEVASHFHLREARDLAQTYG